MVAFKVFDVFFWRGEGEGGGNRGGDDNFIYSLFFLFAATMATAAGRISIESHVNDGYY